MPTPQRLPIVDGDDGQWGDILNQFISKEHLDTGTDSASNGSHKTVTIQPGTTSAGSAPLKLTSGALLTTPEVGAIEFLTNRLYITQTSGATRKVIAAFDDSSGATGDIYFRDATGNFVKLPIGSAGDVLTVDSDTPIWTAPSGGGGGGLSQAQILTRISFRI